MKSHELARRLLAMPNLDVVAKDEDDGFEKIVVSEITILKGMKYFKKSSWNKHPCYAEHENGKEEVIELD